MCRHIIHQILSIDLLNILRGSKNGPPEGRALVGNGVEVVEYHLFNLLLHFLHLAEDHASLPLNLTLAQGWVLDDVTKNVNSCIIGERRAKTKMAL